MSLDSKSLDPGDSLKDMRDVEYQRQAGKVAWRARIYQPNGTNHQDPLSTQERHSRRGDGFQS